MSLPTAQAKRGRLRDLLLSLGVFFLLLYGWTFVAISAPNERSRIYLSVAMVDHHTLSIDTSLKRFGHMMDIAKYKGKHYSDKAPGSSFLGAVVYAVVRLWSEPGEWDIQALLQLMRTWVMVPLGLLGFLVMRRVLYLLDLPEAHAMLGAVAWLLGTSAFYYSTAFYGHQIVAVMLLVSLWQILEVERGRSKAPLRLVVAGLAAGVAGLTEYQAGVPCVMLVVFLATGPKRSWPNMIAFGAGALPMLGLFFWYHNAAFGGPFELSYHHLVVKHLATLHTEGVGGVGAPKLERLGPLTLSHHRGLLGTSPIFLLLVPGLVLLWRAGKKRVALLCGMTLVFYLGITMGTRAWEGGWSFGPRLIVPGMPWMMIAASTCLWKLSQRSSFAFALGKGAAVAGIVLHQGMHLYLSEFDPKVQNPVVDMLLPALEGGWVAPNLGQKILGLEPATSLWPAVVVTGLIVVWVMSVEVKLRASLVTLAHLLGMLVLPMTLWVSITIQGRTIPQRETDTFFRYTKQWQTFEQQRWKRESTSKR